MVEHILMFEADGTMGAIYADALQPYFAAAGGEVRTMRAGHVEPMDGGWGVTIPKWVYGGEHLDITMGPFPTRQEALDRERQFLDAVL